MSAPLSIAIPTTLSVAPLSGSSASSSPTGRYIPVHRRTGSTSSTSSIGNRSSCSSRDSSTARSSFYGSDCSDSSSMGSSHPLVYSRDVLLNLAKSPLSRFFAETRESLRSNVPEIVTNRKQRKTIEYHNTQAAKQQRQALKQQREVIPNVPLHVRRSRPVGRDGHKDNSEKKKTPTTTKVGEDTQWRGRRPASILAPVPI